MTVSGPVSDGRAATNNTEHRYQLRGLTLPRSATRHGGHASKRRGRATAVADVHLVPAYGVVETLCAGHKNEPGRAFASVGPQHSVRPRGSCWVPVSQLMVMASGWTRKGLPEPGRRRVSGRLLAQ